MSSFSHTDPVKVRGVQTQTRFDLPSRIQVAVHSSWATYIRGQECGQPRQSCLGRHTERRATDPLRLDTIESIHKDKCSNMPVINLITQHMQHTAMPLPRRLEPTQAAFPAARHHTALHTRVHAARNITGDLASFPAANRVISSSTSWQTCPHVMAPAGYEPGGLGGLSRARAAYCSSRNGRHARLLRDN